MTVETETRNPLAFPCTQCGAELEFAPGTKHLKCPYCGTENEIKSTTGDVVELDYRSHLQNLRTAQPTTTVSEVTCDGCGATSQLGENVTSDECAFCGNSLRAEPVQHQVMRPSAVLPFQIQVKEATLKFIEWVDSRWFAPNDFSAFAHQEAALKGVYLPYWTYDCEVTTRYRGERGDDYRVQETYTDTDDKGNRVQKTRTVTKTRWRSASGHVEDSFDDVLIIASESLPRNYTQELEPWDLENLVDYKDAYLSGFRSEAYKIDLAAGFELAKDRMEPIIDSTIRRDIGGDKQRIHSKDSIHREISFKHILLPIWVSAYFYKENTFRFMVNGRTGEVQGERPWSWIKITLAVLGVVSVIGAIVYFNQGS